MALLNYSTEISVQTSATEIQSILARHHVSKIMTEYDGAGNMVGLSFIVPTVAGNIPFRLPADPRPVMGIINEQCNKRINTRSSYGYTRSRRAVPARFKNDMDQARRVAWRILKDWIEAQMAIVEVGMVQIHQVFLPYAITASGETVFEKIEAGKAGNLLSYEGGK